MLVLLFLAIGGGRDAFTMPLLLQIYAPGRVGSRAGLRALCKYEAVHTPPGSSSLFAVVLTNGSG